MKLEGSVITPLNGGGRLAACGSWCGG
jgi:hypothetical protein